MTLQSRFCGKWEVCFHLFLLSFFPYQVFRLMILKALNTLLTEWRKDPSTKVLIFTKSVKLLDMLDFYLQDNGEPSVHFLSYLDV